MNCCTVFLLLFLILGLARSNYVNPVVIPAILDELEINQPIIKNELIDAKNLTKIVKHLCNNGQRVSFRPNRNFQPYLSYLIFTDLKDFKWDLPTYVTTLVISRIQNEVELDKVEVSIGSDVLFLDPLSLKVYESYTVNKIHVRRFLGQFLEKDTGKNDLFFVPDKDYLPSMEKRRSNLYGLQIKAATTTPTLGITDFSNQPTFFPKNDSYDVTNLVTISENENYYYNYLLYLKWIETKLNFTAKILLRKDMKMGSPKILSNGSYELGEGDIRDMFEGSIDLLCGGYVMLPEPAQFGTFLLSIDNVYDEIYIPNMDSVEYYDWDTFISPFSTDMWMAIIMKCMIFSIFTYIIEWFHSYKLILYSVFYKIWASFAPNFGAMPFQSKADYIASYRTLVFVFILDGLVLWVTYQSFLYTELSKPLIKNPFSDLNTLAKSGYMLYTGPKNEYVFNVLSGPAYKKVMENNVDLELSFNDWDVSKEKTLKEPKRAYFSDSESSVRYKYKCQFKTAWRSVSFMGVSWIMNKKSQFIKIFSQAILEVKYNGRLDIFYSRKLNQDKHSCIQPDPMQTPLGFKKLAILFVVLISGIFISIFVVLFEFVAKIYSEKQKSTTTIKDFETNPEKDQIKEFLEALSDEETEKALQMILKRQMKTSTSQD